MNNYCTEKYNISSKDFPSAQLRDKQLLIIFLQLVQSRQKKLRNQRKNYCTSISSHSYFGSTKNGQVSSCVYSWKKIFHQFYSSDDRKIWNIYILLLITIGVGILRIWGGYLVKQFFGVEIYIGSNPWIAKKFWYQGYWQLRRYRRYLWRYER